MARKETRDSIDRRWQTLQPGWGRDDFKGERRMLYDAIVEGDNVEHLFRMQLGQRQLEPMTGASLPPRSGGWSCSTAAVSARTWN